MLTDTDMATAIRAAINDSGRTQREIAEAFGVTVQAVSGWLRTGKMDARKLPRLASITGKPLSHFGMIEDPDVQSAPAGYVHFQLLDGVAGMGPGHVPEDFPEVAREFEMAVWEVRRKLGFIPRDGRVRIITGRGDSMTPGIHDGDLLMVDTARDHYDGEGVYIISVDGHIQAKRLQLRPDGLHVLSDNPCYPPWHVSHEHMHDLTIGGRVLSVLNHRAL